MIIRRAVSPVSSPGFVAATDGSGLQPSDLSFADQTLAAGQGWYHAAPLALSPGRATGPVYSRANGLFKDHIPGLFEGQRPGPIPAYGTAIGFWTTNDHPKGCKPGFISGIRGRNRWVGPSALRFIICRPNLGRWPRLVSCRAVGAQERGDGVAPRQSKTARFGTGHPPGLFEGHIPGLFEGQWVVQRPHPRFVRGPTARHHPSLWHRHRFLDHK